MKEEKNGRKHCITHAGFDLLPVILVYAVKSVLSEFGLRCTSGIVKRDEFVGLDVVDQG